MITPIIIIAATVLAFEITLNSTLADEIKHIFGLDLKSQVKLERLSNYFFWQKLFPNKYEIIYIAPCVFFFNFWLKLNQLFNCPFCMSFHLAWIGLYSITSKPLHICIIYGLFSILFGKLYEKIN